MKNKRNGFTLIELLAIIVILAIIAVITVPIILNIIENSRKGAAMDSAYGYKDALSKYYLTKENEDVTLGMNFNGKYSIENGNLKRGTEEHEIKIDGNIPTGGNVMLENSRIILGCIEVEGYAVKMENGTVTSVEKGTCPPMTEEHTEIIQDEPVVIKDPDVVKTNAKYFNPNTGAYCTEEEYNANNPTPNSGAYKNSGCMKWYVFSENKDGTVNMILDHNTTVYSRWTFDGIDDEHPNVDLNSDYYDGASVGISYTNSITDGTHRKNASGPVSALKQLKADTNDWSSSLARSDSYTPTSGDYKYTISYSGYKARLITAEEIAAIVNISWNNRAYYLQSGSSSVKPTYGNNETSTYSWLFDYTWHCTDDGCVVNASDDNLTSGYWTATSADGATGDIHTISSWYVGKTGMFSALGCNNPVYNGIRPVITVTPEH